MAKRHRQPVQLRDAIAQVLEIPKRFYDRSKKEHVERSLTFPEAAKKLGISERQFRRWRNEWPQRAVAPTPTMHHQESVRESYYRARKIIAARNRKLTHQQQPNLPKMPVLPSAIRRRKKIYAQNEQGYRKWTGRYEDSDWVNYDVTRMTEEQTHALVFWLRDRVQSISIIYEAFLLNSGVMIRENVSRVIGNIAIVRNSMKEKLEGYMLYGGKRRLTDQELEILIFPFLVIRTLEQAQLLANNYPQPFRPLFIGVLNVISF